MDESYSNARQYHPWGNTMVKSNAGRIFIANMS